MLTLKPALPRPFARALTAGFALAAATATLASPAAAQGRPSAAARGWYGTYVAQEKVPRGELTGSITTRLTVNNGGCRLRAQGVMTDENIKCTARIRGQSLVISFYSYGDGSMRNQYGTLLYRRGTPLLTLTKTPRGLVTNWQAYTMSDGKRKSGRYFRKSGR
ncbi:DUF5991 domain-containing protein [Pseudonocardia sp. TMWB2A]|uniref:DUF5991 domain-containing protein n=1 Tax=Pseudonocardia sp. TMWB2A TaxID=687430 RepID=UPI00307FC27D